MPYLLTAEASDSTTCTVTFALNDNDLSLVATASKLYAVRSNLFISSTTLIVPDLSSTANGTGKQNYYFSLLILHPSHHCVLTSFVIPVQQVVKYFLLFDIPFNSNLSNACSNRGIITDPKFVRSSDKFRVMIIV